MPHSHAREQLQEAPVLVMDVLSKVVNVDAKKDNGLLVVTLHEASFEQRVR